AHAAQRRRAHARRAHRGRRAAAPDPARDDARAAARAARRPAREPGRGDAGRREASGAARGVRRARDRLDAAGHDRLRARHRGCCAGRAGDLMDFARLWLAARLRRTATIARLALQLYLLYKVPAWLRRARGLPKRSDAALAPTHDRAARAILAAALS